LGAVHAHAEYRHPYTPKIEESKSEIRLKKKKRNARPRGRETIKKMKHDYLLYPERNEYSCPRPANTKIST
jgi:hypothetical protein